MHAAPCWVSIIAELKFYFVQLAILIVLYVLVSRPSIKNVLLVAGLLFGLYFAIQAFYAFMPGWDNYFDLKTLVASNTEGGYGTADGLNRLSAVETIRGLFMTDPASQLFGLGFGAGTYSQFFAAPLYSAWGEVLHWTWFTDAQLFLETGYVGLICYGLFFIGLGVRGLCTRRGSNGEEAVFMIMGTPVVVLDNVSGKVSGVAKWVAGRYPLVITDEANIAVAVAEAAAFLPYKGDVADLLMGERERLVLLIGEVMANG